MAGNTTKVTYDVLAELVIKEFIEGADGKYLKSLMHTLKKGGMLESPSSKYCIWVEPANLFFIEMLFNPKKDVYIDDDTMENTFRLDSAKNWRLFRDEVMPKIKRADF